MCRKYTVLVIRIVLLSILTTHLYGQVRFNKGYDSIPISNDSNLTINLKLQKGQLYQMLVLQDGIDVMLTLKDDKGNKILDQDSPNGSHGLEVFDYRASSNGPYKLVVKRLSETNNPKNGYVGYYIKKFTPREIALKQQSIKALSIENQKHFLTLDINHFWEAYDNLKICKNRWDSLLSFQNLYLDRGTDGLKDFVTARQWSSERFLDACIKFKKYYNSVRPYTYKVKNAEPYIEDVFQKFKSIYANFKPFSVCFAIGFRNTGGTVSNRYVLLGTEMVAAGKDVDFSETNHNWQPDPLKKEKDISQSIRSIVAHECVHTQQPNRLDSNAKVCNQLYYCLREGAANFVGELISGNTNYSDVNKYGDAHEGELWNEFKATLCSENTNKWMYNGNSSKDRPADLGYYIGYKICQAYYQNMTDKSKAIKDIVEIHDPLQFLEKSGYDRQTKR